MSLMPQSSRSLVKIPVSELQVGMYVAQLDRPWEETRFVYQGFFIYDWRDIQELQTQCEFVYVQSETEVVEEEKTVTAPSGKKIRTRVKKERTRLVHKVPAYRELTKAANSMGQARQTIHDVFRAVKLGRDIDMEAVTVAVTDIVDSIMRNPNALQWLSLIKDKDDYTAEHCLRVCVLSIIIGREMGFNEPEMVDIGVCGMLHDVGKVKVPDEILNKPGSLDKDEFEIMKQHSQYGRDILISLSSAPKSAVDVAYSHHEKVDGTGYPRGLSAHQIPLKAKIVGVVDAYDAMTSARVYKDPMSALESLRIIYDVRGRHFDLEVAEFFIKTMGVYPAGHIAELNSGEVGIIVRSNNEYRLKPKILLVLDEKKQLRKETILDLSINCLTDAGKPLRIKEIHPNGTFGVRLENYVKKGLRLAEYDD
ncbi:DUF3391 domain-containing protein [Hahella sp. KA22]|nr:HD-GYP domain-containing protein [Hahella sp. KA22]QAY55106.1 DUF3391 domain-containing protein [Hahella sp. KA22]